MGEVVVFSRGCSHVLCFPVAHAVRAQDDRGGDEMEEEAPKAEPGHGEEMEEVGAAAAEEEEEEEEEEELTKEERKALREQQKAERMKNDKLRESQNAGIEEDMVPEPPVPEPYALIPESCCLSSLSARVLKACLE